MCIHNVSRPDSTFRRNQISLFYILDRENRNEFLNFDFHYSHLFQLDSFSFPRGNLSIFGPSHSFRCEELKKVAILQKNQVST